jgi:hypothetical protein
MVAVWLVAGIAVVVVALVARRLLVASRRRARSPGWYPGPDNREVRRYLEGGGFPQATTGPSNVRTINDMSMPTKFADRDDGPTNADGS